MPELYYPDLTPPAGWHHVRNGLQVRLLPPGSRAENPPATIIVSPLVPRHPTLPPPAELIEHAIFAEARQAFEVSSQKGPTPARSADGLVGVSFEVQGHPRPRFPEERRIYVVLSDASCYYALSYVAALDTFAEHLPAFQATVQSVRAFRGKVIPPENTSPLLIYTD